MLSPGANRLMGKSFYLDNISRRRTALLLETICHLGGKVESFLHKDVTFMVSGSQDASAEQEAPPIKKKGVLAGTGHSSGRDRPNTPRLTPRPTYFASRGMALLEKAIRNNERRQGSTVLDNARSWGVQILYVDDVFLYLKKELLNTKKEKAELKNCGKETACVIKAECLKSPYLKVEDVSRKYKPMYVQHVQSLSFGLTEHLPPPCPEKRPEPKENNKTKEPHKVSSGALKVPEPPVALRPSPWGALNELQGYCECCLEAFSDQAEHLLSDKHQRFLQDTSNYSVLDQLMASLLPGFDPDPPPHTDPSLDSFPPTACPPGGDLVTLSNAEMETVISALRNPVTAFNAAFQSVHAKPPSPALPPDPQPIQANPASHPPSTPILVALLAAPRPPSPCTALPSPEPPTLSPCPRISDQPSDLYSQPPVLSPQVLDSFYALEPLGSEVSVFYTDPPELTPEVPPWSVFMGGHSGLGYQTPSPVSVDTPDISFSMPSPLGSHHGQSCQHSHSLSSVYIESALVPDLASISPSSSESDWDDELLSRLAPAGPAPRTLSCCPPGGAVSWNRSASIDLALGRTTPATRPA